MILGEKFKRLSSSLVVVDDGPPMSPVLNVKTYLNGFREHCNRIG